MERLTVKQLDGTYHIYDIDVIREANCCDENNKNCFSLYEGKAIDKLGAYEDAEEQGKLIHLPCKAGDDIYEFENIDIESCLKNGFCYSDIYVQWTVKSFEIDDMGDVWIHTYRKDPFSYSERVLKADEIGKTVFMTRKEAIEGMRKNEIS